MGINLTNFQGTYSMACRKTDKYLFWKYFFLFWEMLNVVTKIIRLSYYFENVVNEHQMRLNRLSCCFKNYCKSFRHAKQNSLESSSHCKDIGEPPWQRGWKVLIHPLHLFHRFYLEFTVRSSSQAFCSVVKVYIHNLRWFFFYTFAYYIFGNFWADQ